MRCGACSTACPRGLSPSEGIHPSKCISCGRCAKACVAQALEICGKEMSVSDVIKRVLRDKPFFDASGGGMTLTGGEPLMQGEFTLALCRAAKEAGVDVCLETSGFGSPALLQSLAPYVSLFLFDIKESDPARHLAYTGVSNESILENLYMLNHMGASIILRCPIIPGFNDRPDHLSFIGGLAQSLGGVSQVHIEPYHPLGGGKRAQLALPHEPPITLPTPPDIERWLSVIRQHTEKTVRLP